MMQTTADPPSTQLVKAALKAFAEEAKASEIEFDAVVVLVRAEDGTSYAANPADPGDAAAELFACFHGIVKEHYGISVKASAVLPEKVRAGIERIGVRDARRVRSERPRRPRGKRGQGKRAR